MLQAEIPYDLGYIPWLFWIEQRGLPLADSAETAAAGADIAQDKESSRGVTPTLPNIGTARLLADCVEVVLSQNPFKAEIVGTSRRSNLDPVWMSSWHSSLSSA